MKNTTGSPARVETLVSFGILGVLVVIAATILSVQNRYNPAVMPFTADSASGGPAVGTPPPTAEPALIPLPAGVAVLSPPETFTPETLSDKIDGKAELYLSAGFKQLQSQRFKNLGAAESWMEIFVFDMSSHENAFAVYSSQQRDDAVPAAVGAAYAYRTANALYWVHGPYYVELIGADDDESTRALMQAVAEGFVRDRPVEGGAIAEPAFFPPEGLDRAGITMIPANAFGFEKLDRVFTAEYAVDGATLTAFLSDRGSPQDAAALAEAYRAFLTAFGGTSSKAEGLADTVVVEILDAYEVIFARGAYLGGVHEAGDKAGALKLAALLQSRIEDVVHDRPPGEK